MDEPNNSEFPLLLDCTAKYAAPSGQSCPLDLGRPCYFLVCREKNHHSSSSGESESHLEVLGAFRTRRAANLYADKEFRKSCSELRDNDLLTPTTLHPIIQHGANLFHGETPEYDYSVDGVAVTKEATQVYIKTWRSTNPINATTPVGDVYVILCGSVQTGEMARTWITSVHNTLESANSMAAQLITKLLAGDETDILSGLSQDGCFWANKISAEVLDWPSYRLWVLKVAVTSPAEDSGRSE